MQRRKSKSELIAETERTRSEQYLGVIQPDELLALDDYRHFDGGAVNVQGWMAIAAMRLARVNRDVR